MATRHWQTLAGMNRDELEQEAIKLRSEVSNLRRHLDAYRTQVHGIRGAIAALNALLAKDEA